MAQNWIIDDSLVTYTAEPLTLSSDTQQLNLNMVYSENEHFAGMDMC